MEAQYDIFTSDGQYLQTVRSMAEAKQQARYYFEYWQHEENYPDIVVKHGGEEVEFCMYDFPEIWNW